MNRAQIVIARLTLLFLLVALVLATAQKLVG